MSPDSDPRESLGRIVHETRRDFEAERSELKDRPGFILQPWEERHPEQQELDMRIGSAVAARAVADAKGSAGMARQRVLRTRMALDAAEARLAEIRETVSTFLAYYGDSGLASLRVAGDLAHGILQVLDRDGETRERAGEKETP